jgi:uncharacterized membrane protein YedE/YeeE
MFVILGIVLVVAGAILTFAVETTADGVNLDVIGLILMAGGVAAFVAAAVQGAAWQSRSNTKMHVEKHLSSDGRHFVEDVQTD